MSTLDGTNQQLNCALKNSQIIPSFHPMGTTRVEFPIRDRLVTLVFPSRRFPWPLLVRCATTVSWARGVVSPANSRLGRAPRRLFDKFRYTVRFRATVWPVRDLSPGEHWCHTCMTCITNCEYDLYDKYDKIPRSNPRFSHLSPTATYG